MLYRKKNFLENLTTNVEEQSLTFHIEASKKKEELKNKTIHASIVQIHYWVFYYHFLNFIYKDDISFEISGLFLWL